MSSPELGPLVPYIRKEAAMTSSKNMAKQYWKVIWIGLWTADVS